MILIDDRGNAPERLRKQLPDLTGTDVHVTRLELADMYWQGFEEQCWVELKTADDLLNSLKSGHMQDQEAKMLELPGHKFLFVEGLLLSGRRGETFAEIQPKNSATNRRQGKQGKYSTSTQIFREYRVHEFPYSAVINYLARMEDFGITVIQATGPDELAIALSSTYRRSLKAGPSRVTRQKFHALDPRVAALKALPEFTKIPVRGLESLIKEYWTPPLNIPADVKIKKLTDLPGVGRETVRKLLGK